MANTIGNRLLYLFAYKFRNLFFVLTIILLYFAFAENLIYLIFAILSLILGILAHTLRNKVVKKIKS